MSLADELLADLEDDDVLEEDFEAEPMLVDGVVAHKESTQKQYSSVRNLATIIDSEELKHVMDEIGSRQSSGEGKLKYQNKIESRLILCFCSFFYKMSN